MSAIQERYSAEYYNNNTIQISYQEYGNNVEETRQHLFKHACKDNTLFLAIKTTGLNLEGLKVSNLSKSIATAMFNFNQSIIPRLARRLELLTQEDLKEEQELISEWIYLREQVKNIMSKATKQEKETLFFLYENRMSPLLVDLEMIKEEGIEEYFKQ